MIPDCIIIGGGVVGLSLAYELARRGQRVEVVERQELGREASWAGAGILPPAARVLGADPLDALRALSHELHPIWAAELMAETGIDNGYRPCGGIYLARSPGEAAALHGMAALFEEVGIAVERLPLPQLAELEPSLQPLIEGGDLRVAYLAPSESQLRNPWHLKALAAACCKRGVVLHEHSPVQRLERVGDRIRSAVTQRGILHADRFCLAAGAWSFALLRELAVPTGIFPVRGQMVMYRSENLQLSRVLNEGSRYVVPRGDGRILIGSTEEEVGFDKSTTVAQIRELQDLAEALLPQLKQAEVTQSWAGLRPASYDGLPYLGRVPEIANAFVAAGHFRSGLHLSTGTARVMGQLICGEQPELELNAFQLCRGAAAGG